MLPMWYKKIVHRIKNRARIKGIKVISVLADTCMHCKLKRCNDIRGAENILKKQLGG
jgi:hypothetical protein